MTLATEQLYGLKALVARAQQRVNGKRLSYAMLWRWCRKGLRCGAGTRIRLESRRVGHDIMTSVEAVDRFWAAMAEASAPPLKPRAERPVVVKPWRPRRRTTLQRARDIERAERICDEAGI